MSRVRSGHIRHYRKEMDSYVWSLKPEYYKVWQTILLSVNWKESTIDFAGEPRTIKPGQMVTGIEDLAKKTGKGVSESQTRRALEKLESANMIKRESTNKGSVITVSNWSKYQVLPDGATSNQQATDKQATSNSQASGKQATTYEEEKKGNKGKRNKEESDLPPPTPTQFKKKFEMEMPDFIPCYLTEKRKRKLRTRRNEKRFTEHWEKIIEKASESSFLIGSHNRGDRDGSFFDATWLIKNQENYIKVLEGKYDDQGTVNSVPEPGTVEQWEPWKQEQKLKKLYPDTDDPAVCFFSDVEMLRRKGCQNEREIVEKLQGHFSEHGDLSDFSKKLKRVV